MPKILSVSEVHPSYSLSQDDTEEFARELFAESFRDIDRLLTVFSNGQIENRNFACDLEWFKGDHSFQEKNDLYIQKAVEYGSEAVEKCLNSRVYLKKSIPYEEIDAFFFISTTGLSTPSIEARIMNHLPFSFDTKRIPIWGLGCAGGAAGLSRAYEYCLAFPESKVLVLSVELCSLTFQKNDRSKSNLIGTSLFSDGIACVCLTGDHVDTAHYSRRESLPRVIGTQSRLMPNSEDVMGWNIRNEGLFVVFSKDIPTIIKSWLSPVVEGFLKKHGISLRQIRHFIAHPGGKKVLEAYQEGLGMGSESTEGSLEVLKKHGNMSSATVLYVLNRFMQSSKVQKGDIGLAAALGPGFSAELLLFEWE